jgi:hypothetical protein
MLLARGIKHEPGSVEDTFARHGMEIERRIEYTKTLAIVNAIISVGNHISSAVTGSQGTKDGGDKVTKTMEALKALLVPEEAETTTRDAKRAKELLKREAESGPVKFQSMAHKKDKKGHVRLKV